MAKRYTIQLLMNLAKSIGANPNKFMGTRTNITFLGKGPTKNPLFQSPIAGLETASEASLGPKESIIGAVEDAMGFASAQKLNSIQIQALGLNLENILKVYKPPVLPTASVTPIASGIEGLRRFPRETHKFFGRPLKDTDFTEIDRLFQGPITSTGPKGTRTWDFSKKSKLRSIQGGKEWTDKAGRKWIRDEKGRPIQITEGLGKYRLSKFDADMKRSRLQETGPGAFNVALNQKTGMSRAVARQILQQDTRLNLKPEELYSLRTGKGEPLDLMQKYYGRSVMNLDDFLDDILSRPPRSIKDMNIKDIAARVLSEVELVPQFAEGGLAEVLQAPRSGYSKGRLVRGALAILNRNKKNAEYMFKASDNVSPGYARGDLKYNAELLAEQLAEDAGILYEDLGALEQTKFYGTAYDYLAAEMGKNLLRKRNLAKVTQALGTGEDLSGVSPAYGEKYANQLLMDWKPGKGRKPSASGGLARILEV